MQQFAKRFGLGQPPEIAYTKSEMEFIKAYGPIEVKEVELPLRLAPVAGVAVEQMWHLLAPSADPDENLEGLVSRLEHLLPQQREAMALTVRKQLDRWQERASTALSMPCATDSEELHAMCLILGGKRLWDRALRAPEDHLDVFPVDPGLAEEALVALGYYE